MKKEGAFWPRSAVYAAVGTVLVFAAQLLRLPPLRDAATGGPLWEFALEFPLWHLLTTPFSAFADWVTFNGLSQDKVLLAWLLAAYWAFWLKRRLRREGFPAPRQESRLRAAGRALGGYLLYLIVVAGFLAWATLSPRPMARLRAPHPDDLVLDFHSHTSRSWDGRRSFTPRANMAWHAAGGFSAAFVTDHNTVPGSAEARQISREEHGKTGYRSLFGEELSLDRCHIVVLSPKEWIDNRPYDGSLEGLQRLLGECGTKHGALCVLSLPEYWLRHWERVGQLADWGAQGVEIVNSAPKGLDFPAGKKREIIELCRRKNLFMVGATDNHGWSRAVLVWNVMRVPGHSAMGPDELEKTVKETLLREGFGAVRVVERVRREPAGVLSLAFDPLLGLWTMARTFTLLQAAVSAAWFWLLAALFWKLPKIPD
ncbi:MAG TPA: hypothetical protein DCM05_12655 [Elusimicrobia bacterium]|nr:hypothetical protein [Elusimicrobiota bacterium]